MKLNVLSVITFSLLASSVSVPDMVAVDPARNKLTLDNDMFRAVEVNLR